MFPPRLPSEEINTRALSILSLSVPRTPPQQHSGLGHRNPKAPLPSNPAGLSPSPGKVRSGIPCPGLSLLELGWNPSFRPPPSDLGRGPGPSALTCGFRWPRGGEGSGGGGGSATLKRRFGHLGERSALQPGASQQGRDLAGSPGPRAPRVRGDTGEQPPLHTSGFACRGRQAAGVGVGGGAGPRPRGVTLSGCGRRGRLREQQRTEARASESLESLRKEGARPRGGGAAGTSEERRPRPGPPRLRSELRNAPPQTSRGPSRLGSRRPAPHAQTGTGPELRPASPCFAAGLRLAPPGCQLQPHPRSRVRGLSLRLPGIQTCSSPWHPDGDGVRNGATKNKTKTSGRAWGARLREEDGLPGQPGLQGECKACLTYTARPCVKKQQEPGVVAHACSSSTGEAEAGGSL
ncbi:uncharacterized protein LOC110346049 [Heterocephalus glaber]|uniref:Uncharacterized protein LOC110346049 n=1 Tax=Heterocephalus glaber TaxID=10181 RepID=A0AAX6RXZ6_HETGA|nr:uncharacterized protein LOC110346049 [Heterocephalus glaber]